MVNAQEWLNQKYPDKEKRKNLHELEIEQDHPRDTDNWYRNSMTAELNTKITNLELTKEKEGKSR